MTVVVGIIMMVRVCSVMMIIYLLLEISRLVSTKISENKLVNKINDYRN